METNSQVPKKAIIVVLIMWLISLAIIINSVVSKKHKTETQEQVYNPNEDELDSIEYSRRIITNE